MVLCTLNQCQFTAKENDELSSLTLIISGVNQSISKSIDSTFIKFVGSMKTGNILLNFVHYKNILVFKYSVLSSQSQFSIVCLGDMAQRKHWTSFSLFLTTYTDA